MCHVLIIEDEAIVAMDVQGLLAAIGATSFSFAMTQDEAVREARRHPPALITSDVKLAKGTGPRAVEQIQRELGDIPVIFITATPEDCEPCEPPARVLRKPMHEPSITQAFLEMAPLGRA